MEDDWKEEVEYHIRWVAGLLSSGVLVYLSILSIQEGYSLESPVIIGLLTLVVVLMYGADALEDILDSWRGGSDD